MSAKEVELETLLKNYLEFFDSSYIHDWMLRAECKDEYELLGEVANNIELVFDNSLSQDEKDSLTNKIVSETKEVSKLFEIMDKKKQLKN